MASRTKKKVSSRRKVVSSRRKPPFSIPSRPNYTIAPVGSLGEKRESVRLVGQDQSGKTITWLVHPTGPRSFEITLPQGHEVGDPRAWEGISIMTQKAITPLGSLADCGAQCNGQCGCQGNNCGSQGNLLPSVRLPR